MKEAKTSAGKQRGSEITDTLWLRIFWNRGSIALTSDESDGFTT